MGAILNKPSLFSGNYNDLSNKPTIPAAQVQSDWNATTGLGVILNKPSIPTVPSSETAAENGTTLSLVTTGEKYTWNNKSSFSGNYNDLSNKPTIPTVPANETATNGGSTLSVVTTGEKYTWNNKASVWSGTQAQYTALSPNYDNNTIYIITAS